MRAIDQFQAIRGQIRKYLRDRYQIFPLDLSVVGELDGGDQYDNVAGLIIYLVTVYSLPSV